MRGVHIHHIISPLNVVPKKGGKLRLITNLRALNQNINLRTFRSEDIRLTSEMIQQDDYINTVDLKDCFFHLPVHPSFRDFLGVFFEGKFYRWAVLPFGLNMSPYFCNKILRPIVQFLRDVHHLRVQCYVDDWIILSPLCSITGDTDTVLHTLDDLGLIVNF